MDVDLLRPGTVPIAPETILWFEFLLDQELLLKHLEKEAADPSPTELIIKFSSVICELQKIEKKPEENSENTTENLPLAKPVYTLKMLALKMLSLKVAAFLNWDLKVLCTLPMKIQINLLQDLLQFTNEQWIETQNIHEYSADIPKHHLFALVLYHRWLIKICFNQFPLKTYQNTEVQPPETMLYTPESIDKSLKFLIDALSWDETPNFIAYDSFIMPTEVNSEIKFEWGNAVAIPKQEFQAQLHYDLATYNFFKENYSIAIPYFISTMQCMINNSKLIGFLTVNSKVLEGFLIASNSKNGHTYSLTKQLKISIVSQFVGLLNIFLQDITSKEIPWVHRVNIEINIRSALSCGKFTVARDLLPKVQVLNVIRFAVETYHTLCTEANNFHQLSWGIMKVWDSLSAAEQNKIQSYLLRYFINNGMRLENLKETQPLRKILNENTVKSISCYSEQPSIPQLLMSTDWDIYEINVSRNPYMEIKLLEEKIILSYNVDELRELLVKLTMRDSSVNVSKINSKWELPIPLQSVIMAMPRGFVQDFGFVLLAKSKELMLSKDWNSSISLLNVLFSEVQKNQIGNTLKLLRLIKLEILLIQMNELLESWPALHLDKKALYNDCECCLKMNESVLPRSEIIEYCIICLINLNHWDLVTNPDKLWNNFEIAIALAAACQELIKFKCVKKSFKDLWDLILPLFSTPSQTKRSSSGAANVIHRESQSSSAKLRLLSLFHKLRDSTALSIVVSLLAKLYNILKDEASLELYIDYMNFWPAVVSNANSYSETNVLETLTKLVLQTLQYYPTNVAFLRLMGDINFANFNYDVAISYYLKYLLVFTDYFNMPVRSDDNLFRRLIKCCSSLNYHTQAAIFCQFLDEADYMQAFRSLAEQKTCFDTVDGYYHCFWDVNILEFLIYHHHKRMEVRRRKHAIQTIGLLELNASNNEEIQHEASSIRKKTFLQAMCRQFISF